MSESTKPDQFRTSVREWVEGNFPSSLSNYVPSMEDDNDGSFPDLELWRKRLAEKGWGAPTWPTEYGGAGVSHPEAKVISQEINRVGGFNPIPALAGMG